MSAPTPLLTVGLPVHNAMPYLRAAVESVLAQTHRDFRLLAVDDGSTDGSLDYLRSLDDPRVRVIAQPRRGLTATLNQLLVECDTPWLVRMGARDVAYPDYLRHIAEAIARAPNAGMFYADADYFRGRATDVRRALRARSVGSRTTVAAPEALRELTRSGYLLAICRQAVTLNVAKTRALGGFRFDLQVEDVDLWWRMALAHDVRHLPHRAVRVRLAATRARSAELDAQALNACYVQYLLLSHLRGVAPLPYQLIMPRLARVIDARRLRFRRHARGASMALAARRPLAAATQAARALAVSPTAFARHVAGGLRRDRRNVAVRPDPVTSGEDPRLYTRLTALFWPDAPRPRHSELRNAAV